MDPAVTVMELRYPSMEAYLFLSMLLMVMACAYAAGCWTFYYCCSGEKHKDPPNTMVPALTTTIAGNIELYQIEHDMD